MVLDPGTSMAAASLAITLFTGCIQGLIILSTAHDLGKDVVEMRCRCNYEEWKLTEWAKRAGLLGAEGKLDERLDETLVNQLLAQLEALLTDTDKMKRRYGIEVEIDPSAPSAVAKSSGESVYATPVLRALSSLISEDTRMDIMLRGK